MVTIMTKQQLTNILSRSVSVIAGSAILSSTILVAHAGNMYIYKDKSGEVLLTNVNPSGNFNKFTQKVKVTYYPSSTSDTSDNPASASTAPSNYGNYSDYGTPSNNSNRDAYDGFIRASANRNGVDPALLKAMMHTESAFNPNARSPVGAQGLMQLMPATARRFDVNNPWNPAENIEGSAKYVAWLSRRFNGRLEHVVAGYNAGEGNVDKYGGIPPFKETQGYVKKVLGRYNTLYKNDASLANLSAVRSVSGTNVTVMPASYNGSMPSTSNYASSAFDALR